MTIWCPKRQQWGPGDTEDSYDGGSRLTQAVLTTRTPGSLEQRLPGWAWCIAEEFETGWHHWKEPGWSHQHCCVAMKKWVTHAAAVFLRCSGSVTIINLIVTPAGTHSSPLLQPADRGGSKKRVAIIFLLELCLDQGLSTQSMHWTQHLLLNYP